MRFGGGRRIATEPMGKRVLKGQTLGFCSGQAAFVFPHGRALVKVSLPALCLLGLGGSGPKFCQQLSLRSPEACDKLIGEHVGWPTHDEVRAMRLDRNAPPF